MICAADQSRVQAAFVMTVISALCRIDGKPPIDDVFPQPVMVHKSPAKFPADGDATVIGCKLAFVLMAPKDRTETSFGKPWLPLLTN